MFMIFSLINAKNKSLLIDSLVFIIGVSCLLTVVGSGIEDFVVEGLVITEDFFDVDSKVSFGRNELSSSDKSPDKSMSSSTAKKQFFLRLEAS